ncbi:MAG: dephospho-CoA kinase [Desulfuromonadaceae bacterium]|nr:dephospho-CoA kinase [Desulfuromonadaceae bacterium]MDD2855466.1 dephospho-CoA kinase [Desulfuromonadaceae bacterium]
MSRPKRKIIGLTGGIATGKSSVARYFVEKGVPVIDADQLARDAVRPRSPALELIVASFGSEVIENNGELDRKRLSSLVFSAPDKRRLLEGILHPEIRKLAEAAIEKVTLAGYERIIYMAPLLIEAGATDRVDTVWVVTVTPEIQIMRLMQRDAISREEAERIIASQMPLAEKESFGSVIIDNSGTEAQTRAILDDIWEKETGNINE